MITPELVEKIIAQIEKRYANYEYFFERLSTPDWILPLKDRNFFKNPPDPDREGGMISFPFWPESQYLARMAQLAPSVVSRTILDIPLNDNYRVHADILEAAINMPIDDGFPVLVMETKWLNSQSHIYLIAERISNSILYLVSNGRTKAALSLTRTILELSQKSSEDQEKQDVASKLDFYDYKRILETTIPELAGSIPIETCGLLCDILEYAVKIQRGTGRELSCMWQAAVEDHVQNRESDLRNLLVKAIRQIVETSTSSEMVEEFVKLFREKEGFIFERIVLHTLRIHFEQCRLLAIQAILDEKLFRSVELLHEYALLLKERFKELSSQDQLIILGWIKNGINSEGDPNVDRDNIWKLDKLSLIKDDLPEEWNNVYQTLLDKYGHPRHPDFTVYFESWRGPTSTLNEDQILSMPLDKLVDYLMGWEPEAGWAKPTREGLGRVINSAAKKEPEKFAMGAELFKRVDPSYVNNLVLGLIEALSDNKVFAWLPVLSLCEWIVRQPIEIPGRISEYGEKDLGWTWTRRSIASLLRQGFQAQSAAIPYQFRELCWNILLELENDAEPSPDMEKEYLDGSLEPLNLAINTVRGEALIAIVHYALWVRSFLEKDKKYKGLQSVSEVQVVLEKHLDSSIEPSLAIRSVYGYLFTFLVYLDRDWALGKVANIYPSDPAVKEFRDAAWDTYIVSSNVYYDVYDVLRDEYKRAIDELDPEPPAGWKKAVFERTIEHIAILCGSGKTDDKMIETFFEKVTDNIRASFIENIGRSLMDEKVPSDIINRYQHLWEWRTGCQDAKPASHQKEIMSFGWLFASNQFDAEWSMRNLNRALKLAGTVEPVWLVAQHLDNEERIPAEQALVSLDLLIRGLGERWEVFHISKHIKSIIEKARRSSPEAQVRVQELINYLTSLGYREFIR